MVRKTLINITVVRFHRWPEDGITLLQIKYIGLLLNMGLVHKKKYADYWSTREADETPVFGKVVSCHEFTLKKRMLHLNDVTQEIRRGEDGFDIWCKVGTVLEQQI